MICPFCQEAVAAFVPGPGGPGANGLRCPRPDCVGRDNDIPVLYTRDYSTHPAIPVSVFGPGGHGKTVFLEAFVTTLERHVRWPRFSCQWMDEAGMADARARLRALRETGELPGTTQAVFPTPKIFRLRNVPRVGGCQLLMYDTSGETFRDTEFLVDAGRYVKNSPAVVWLVSLTELDYPEQLSDLMTTYAQGMARMGADPRGQSLVLTLTKGDLLVGRPDFPAAARAFLAADDLDPAGDAWDRLAKVSDALGGWLETTEHRNVVNLIRDQFRDVKFCVVSAQGAAAKDQVLQMELMPRGVLAPLFWLWKLNAPGATVEAGGRREPHFGLAAAVAAAPAGATVRLDPGVHRLGEPLRVGRPVTLAGTAAGAVRVECAAGKFLLGVKTAGTVTVRSVTLAHTGTDAADIVRALGGRVVFEDCVVTGGAGGPTANGDGVVAGQGATVDLVRCELARNARHGLAATEGSVVSLTDGTVVANGGSGLHLTGKSAAVTGTAVAGNGRDGVTVDGDCRAEFTAATLRGNGRDGVAVGGTASVALARVASADNKGHGVAVRKTGRAELTDPEMRGNRQSGLAAEDGAAVTVTGGEFAANGMSGLFAAGTSAVSASGTRAVDNAGAGFVFGLSSTGTLTEVTATGNGMEGVRVVGKAVVTLSQSDLSGNAKGDRYAAPTASIRPVAPLPTTPVKPVKKGWFA